MTHPNKDFFADTRLEVVFGHGAECVAKRVFLADSTAAAWDGALPNTNGAVYSERHGRFSYVELKLTGRFEKKHTGGIYGLKARVRFTGADDSNEWHDAVVRHVPASFGAVV